MMLVTDHAHRVVPQSLLHHRSRRFRLVTHPDTRHIADVSSHLSHHVLSHPDTFVLSRPSRSQFRTYRSYLYGCLKD